MEWHGLSPRARWAFHLGALMRLGLFWTPVVGVVALVSLQWVSFVTALIAGMAALSGLLVLAIWLPGLEWSRWAWTVRDGDLLVASGVLVRSVVSIPLDRVQHVDLRQGPVDQWFGLQRVLVYTASGRAVDGVIPGLEPEVAEALRDRLVRAAGHDGV
jgi:membrane protein YdbS with pleckstrin-like domain